MKQYFGFITAEFFTFVAVSGVNPVKLRRVTVRTDGALKASPVSQSVYFTVCCTETYEAVSHIITSVSLHIQHQVDVRPRRSRLHSRAQRSNNLNG